MPNSKTEIDKWADEFYNSNYSVTPEDFTYIYKCHDNSRDRLTIVARKLQILQAIAMTILGYNVISLRFVSYFFTVEFFSVALSIILITFALWLFTFKLMPKPVDSLPDVPDILANAIGDGPDEIANDVDDERTEDEKRLEVEDEKKRGMLAGIYETIEANDVRAGKIRDVYNGMATALLIAFVATVVSGLCHIAGV